MSKEQPRIKVGTDIIPRKERVNPEYQIQTDRKETRKLFQLSIETPETTDTQKAIACLDFLLQFLPHANLPEKYNMNVLQLLELKQILNKRLQTPDTETPVV